MARSRESRDRAFLDAAAVLAPKGRGFVEPNPVVGAVLVRSGEVIARGWHKDFGGPHAEVAVLRRAGRQAKGATLYVTLEPCCTSGKTPPCTDAIVAARPRRVVAGALDPDPRHGGRGLELLAKAGIAADLVPHAGCDALLATFRKDLALRRPRVVLKWAMTLDGKIAARDGSSRWVSGERSRRIVHRLRGHCDAVMVGSRTVLRDDPRLDCRHGPAPLAAARVVVDPRLETPPSARLLQPAGGAFSRRGPAWIIASAQADPGRKEGLVRAGAEVIPVPANGEDRAAFLELALGALFERGVRRLLVEGGSALFTSFVEARLADQVVAFVAPSLAGGEGALSPLEGIGAPSMDQAIRLGSVAVSRSGDDAMLVGFF